MKKITTLFLLVAGFPGILQAAAFQLLEQNASGLGNAYAGQAAAAENASTIFYNPAALTLLPGAQISGAAVAIRPSVKFSDAGGSIAPTGAALPAGGGNGGDAGGWNYVPNLYFSKQLSPNLWAGIGLTVPYGLKTHYDSNFIGRFQAQKTEIKSYDLNPSIAYKLSDAVSLGGGISYQHLELKLNRSAFIGTEAASTVAISDSNWGWNAGALLIPSPGTRIGLSYRSSMSHHLRGTIQLNGAPGFPTTGTAQVRLPATSSIALSQQLSSRWQMLSDFTYTTWSSIQDTQLVLASGIVADTFRFQFQDSWRVGVGANYAWSPDMTLKLGIAYEKSPAHDKNRMVELPDNNRIAIAIGGKIALSKKTSVSMGYQHLFVSRGSINQQNGVGVLAQGSVIGTYHNSGDILAIQYTYAF